MQNNNIHKLLSLFLNFIQNQLLKQIWAPHHIIPNLLNIINSILIVYIHPCAVILIQTLHQNPRRSYEGNGKKVQVNDSSNKSNIMKLQLHNSLQEVNMNLSQDCKTTDANSTFSASSWLKTNSTTTSSSIPRISVIFCAIHGFMTSSFTFDIST